MEEIHLKTRDWERLLNYTQQQKYKLAIKQGWFAAKQAYFRSLVRYLQLLVEGTRKPIFSFNTPLHYIF